MHTPAWGGIEFDLYHSYMVPLYIMKGRLRKLHSLYETQMSLSINKQPTEAKEDPYIPLFLFRIFLLRVHIKQFYIISLYTPKSTSKKSRKITFLQHILEKALASYFAKKIFCHNRLKRKYLVD